MYIVLEGIDGSGKTTQCQLLSESLKNMGYDVEIVVEPTQSEIGKLIRKQLQDDTSTTDINQQKLSLLFAADRLTLKHKIQNSTDKIILSDRSYYSSIAYQNSDSIDPKWIEIINKYAPKPDLTILFDVDEDVAIERCDETEVFEKLDFLRKTRKNYLRLLEENSEMIKIDSTGSIDDVKYEVLKLLSDKLDL
ncbi:MAG: dTMP kinase [Methanosphaera sp.]|uniref:dTMP kinase n=1 Tax=Methanosphaera sp. TaxID=2666342 RepID=UPI0025F696B6|nr:dTMP kinase [Methanosphaera sp.]MCI5867789.1 dTMP kinase [Methanosphaera sp.]MDD6535252.1 dTMP kinase [Methanosphaera sp.]MDY3956413.1 dTMP kinase [Methanosphaera sp.]